ARGPRRRHRRAPDLPGEAAAGPSLATRNRQVDHLPVRGGPGFVSHGFVSHRGVAVGAGVVVVVAEGVDDVHDALDPADHADDDRDQALHLDAAGQVDDAVLDADVQDGGVVPQLPDDDVLDDLVADLGVGAVEHAQQVAAGHDAGGAAVGRGDGHRLEPG